MFPFAILPESFTLRLACVLVQFLWQGAALAVLLALTVWLLRVRRPTTRYACSVLTLLATVACPAVTWVQIQPAKFKIAATTLLPAHVADMEPAAAESQTVFRDAEPVESPIPPVEMAPAAKAISAWTPSVGAPLVSLGRNMQPWLVLGWAVGVTLLSVRLLLGAIGVWRWRRCSEPVPDGVADRVYRWAATLRSRAPAVRLSCRVTEAVAVGFIKPMILLPIAWATELPADMLDAVIAHELAHIRRGDLWLNLLQRLVETLLFYHPAVWWLSRRLRIERELCCDELAVAATQNRLRYAETLQHIGWLRVTAASSLAIGIAPHQGTLLRRIRQVLQLTPAHRSGSAGVAGLAPLLVVLGALSTLAVRHSDDVAAEDRNTPVRTEKNDRTDEPLSDVTIGLAAKHPGESEPAGIQRQAEAKEDRSASYKDRLPAPEAGNPWLISGQVVDEKGQAVKGATLKTRDHDTGGHETVTNEQGTNEQGEFEIAASADAQSCLLTVTDMTKSRLWMQEWHRWWISPDRPDTTRLKVVLLPTREVTVDVSDANGSPVEMATVLVREQFFDVAVEQTNKDGVAKVRLPGNATKPTIYAFKPGAGYDYFSTDVRDNNNYPQATPEVPTQLKLTLGGSQMVRIKAVDSSGLPLAGIGIQPWYVNRNRNSGSTNLSGSDVFVAKTNADGIAVFDWLPTDRRREVTFFVYSSEFCSPDPLTIGADDRGSDFEFRLLRRAKLAGQVVFDDGQPAAGVSVLAQGEGVSIQGGSGRANTGMDGRFEMSVYPNQAYIVAIADHRWAANRIGVVVREGQPVSDLELRLTAGTVVTGRVERGPGMTPVAGEAVTLRLEGGRIPDEIEELKRPDDHTAHFMTIPFGTRTDADGRFRFVAGPGDYVLFGPTNREPVKFTIKSERQIVHDIHFDREERTKLAGVVVDAGGKPLAKAKVEGVYASPFRHRSGFDAETDHDGRFSREREKLPCVVHVRSEDGKLGMVVTLDANSTVVRFELRPTAMARGRLLNADGQILPGVLVQYGVEVHDGDKDSTFAINFGGKVKTDADGRYELPNLDPGAEWRVDLERPDGRLTRLTSATVGQSVDIDLGDTKLTGP